MGLRALTVVIVVATGCARTNAGGRANPLAGNPTAPAQGEKLFASMNCDGCHGGGAIGFAAPSLVDGRWRYGGEDSTVFRSIVAGRPRGMPAFGALLDDGTIWQLVSYLRAQPVPNVVPTQVWP